MAVSMDRFLTKFNGVKKTGANWMAKCPAHDDQKPSLSIKQGREGGIVLFCHGGCETKNVLAAAGWSVADIQSGRPDKNGNRYYSKNKTEVASFDYRDESGKLLYQAVRYEPKDFKQRRPDGVGGWIFNLEGVARVLYRLPELIADDSNGWVFIPEGEKHVDALRTLGLVATCNVGGAGKWRNEYAKHLRGRRVCILPDNDPHKTEDGKRHYKGQAHAVKIYDSLRDTAKCVIILALPDLPLKGDVLDWLGAGGMRNDLIRMADDLAQIPVEQFVARVSEYSRLVADPDFDKDPAVALSEVVDIHADQIVIDHGMIKKLHELTRLSWMALSRANKPPKYFRRGSMLVKVAAEDGGVSLKELTPERMRCELDLVGDWRKMGADHKPPKDVVANVLVWPDRPLPALNSIVEVPIFGPNGMLQTEPGYHPDGKVYYHPPRHLKCLPVPQKPTPDQVAKAVKLIREMIHDFPFEGDADRCHAIAFFLLPFCREMIDGPTPLHLFEASKARSGKGLLIESLLYPSMAEEVFELGESGKNQDEWEKKLTTALTSGKSAVNFDNINNKLDSGHVARALTQSKWDGRMLGRNVSANVPIRNVWVGSGNNVTMSEEIAGRTIRARIVPAVENPELRTGWLHPNLKEWVIAQRENLIHAAHIIIQNWIANGRPKFETRTLGRFERWAETIGGILELAGVTGFLANYEVASEDMNVEKAVWRVFCERWYIERGSRAVTAPDLLPIAKMIEQFYLSGDDDKDKSKSLGWKLRSRLDHVYEFRDSMGNVYQSVQISNDAPKKDGVKQYRLKSMHKTDAIEEPISQDLPF